MTPFIRELRLKDPIGAFAAIQHLPYSILFDSADRDHPNARYSFIVSHPIETIESKDGTVTLTNWEEQTKQDGDAFTILQERIAHWVPLTKTVRGLPPFQGGAAGYFGYDLARGLEKLPESAENNPDMPDMAIGIYDQVLAFDHEKDQAWIITHAKNYHDARKKQDYILGLIACPPVQQKFTGASIDWAANFTKDNYKKAVSTVIDYIKAGDIFQANMTQRFDADLPKDFDKFGHYQHMRSTNAAPFSAYMNCGDITLSSASPERFITVKDRMVETRPIKGTRPRDADDNDQDELNRCALEASTKDLAENTMIVDLLRNDLSKTCLSNSVRVTDLCKTESFSGVHHLVSTIRGTLRKNKSPLDLIKTSFPGGSITGAPKIRAMEIIEELEPTRRAPYCGAMGYVGFDATMDTNILIRTLVYDKNTVSLQVGGGIVADSDPEAEYQETLDKAKGIFDSFKTDCTVKTKIVEKTEDAAAANNVIQYDASTRMTG
jgi:para-aminobenzoate synthetase component 1